MDCDWQPPTEAELKVIQANKERSDKISSVLGDYLLKGYKMMASMCITCNTVLLQDKQKKLICVACSEIDNENARDDLASSEEAARRQVRESEINRTSTPKSSKKFAHDLSISEAVQVNFMGNGAKSESNNVQRFQNCQNTLIDKINWASERIKSSNSLVESTEYCNFIKSCAEALISVSTLKNLP